MNQNELYHFGILGQKWGIRRYQNLDGTLTEEGRRRYLQFNGRLSKDGRDKYGYTINKLQKSLEKVNNVNRTGTENDLIDAINKDIDVLVKRDGLVTSLAEAKATNDTKKIEKILDDYAYGVVTSLAEAKATNDTKKVKDILDDYGNIELSIVSYLLESGYDIRMDEYHKHKVTRVD